MNGALVGTTISRDTGSYVINAPSGVTSGQYAVSVTKSKIKKKIHKGPNKGKKKKIVCSPASETITVP